MADVDLVELYGLVELHSGDNNDDDDDMGTTRGTTATDTTIGTTATSMPSISMSMDSSDDRWQIVWSIG